MNQNDFPPWKATIQNISDAIDAMKAEYGGRLGLYQYTCIAAMKSERRGRIPPPGFCVEAYFNDGGNLLLDWPFVDLDTALRRLKFWRCREEQETVGGVGWLRKGAVSLAFGGFELETDDSGQIIHREYETAIRSALRTGLFPEWRINGFSVSMC